MRVDDLIMARVEGRWQECRVLHVHPDGTLTVLPLSAPYRFLNDWTGITAAETCTDDRWRWSELFWKHAVDSLMGAAELQALYAAHDMEIGLEDIEAFLRQQAARHEGVDPDSPRFDEEQAYAVLKAGGGSVIGLEERVADAPSSKWHRLYWNNLRMGGRDPSERPGIGWDEAMAALELTEAEHDGSVEASLVTVEQAAGTRLPEGVRRFLCATGAGPAFIKAHPNNPRIVSREYWKIRTDGKERGHSGAFAMHLVAPYGGEHVWWITWDEGDEAARVEIRWPDGTVKPVAPSLAFFVWDLDGTGRAWEEATGNERGLPGD